MRTLSQVSDVVDADNDALIELASKCAMEGQVGLCIERAPEFLTLDRLEGDDVRVGVTRNTDGQPVGCIAIAKKQAYVNGHPTLVNYIGDLKVDPQYRKSLAVGRLIHWVNQRCLEDESALSFLAILEGNYMMQSHTLSESRMRIRRVGTVRSHSIGLLWRRRLPSSELVIIRATEADAEEMVNLWRRIAPRRQFSTVFTSESFVRWIGDAPGLGFEDYLLARDGRGRLRAFVGVWDQSSFKQTRITSYSPSLKVFKAGFNIVGPKFGTPKLPPVGEPLSLLSAVHTCVEPEDVAALRSLLLTVYGDYRDSKYSFFTIGLDKNDHVRSATKGLLAQPTDIAACTYSTVNSSAPTLDGRPIHHEIALV